MYIRARNRGSEDTLSEFPNWGMGSEKARTTDWKVQQTHKTTPQTASLQATCMPAQPQRPALGTVPYLFSPRFWGSATKWPGIPLLANPEVVAARHLR